jgi:hypothetical protein
VVEEPNLPKTWSDNVFILKVFFPLGFLAFAGIFASGANHNLFSAIFFFVVFVPMIAAGVSLLRTVQLRSDGRVIGYRRWFRWQILPLSDIEEIRGGIWVVGAIRLAGHRKLHFFVEPENRDLLDFKAGSAESLESRMNPPVADDGPDRPILYVLAGIAGFAIETILPVMPPADFSQNGWLWLDEYVKFLDRHSSFLAGLMLVALGWRIREKKLKFPERLILAIIIGCILAGLLKSEIRGL